MKKSIPFIIDEIKKFLKFQTQVIVGIFRFVSKSVIISLRWLPWIFIGFFLVKLTLSSLKSPSKVGDRPQLVKQQQAPLQTLPYKKPYRQAPPYQKQPSRLAGWDIVQRRVDKALSTVRQIKREYWPQR